MEKGISIGSIYVWARIGASVWTVQLSNVLHVPSFRFQLLFVPTLASLGVNLSFNDSACSFHHVGKVFDTGY